MSSNLYDDLFSWLEWGNSPSQDTYEEQAAIIQDLQDELERMKSRENHLIREYLQKLRKLEDPETAAALESICKTPFDEDMPVDEFTSKVRAEQRSRRNDDIQSRRFLIEVKTKMEAILKDKMKEVLVLEKKVETLEKEKENMSRQLEQHKQQESNRLVSPIPISAVDSVIGTQFMGDETLNDTSFSLNHPSEISLDSMSKALDHLLQGSKDAQHYSHLGNKEMQLFDKFEFLHTQVVQKKTMAVQQKMDKLVLSSKEKDSRIQDLQHQVKHLQLNVQEKEETLTQSISERNTLIHQLEEVRKQMTAEKETWIQKEAKIQEKNDETIRAIQRVLAELTMTKDREIIELKERLHRIAGEERLMEPL